MTDRFTHLPEVLGWDELAAVCGVEVSTVKDAAWRERYGVPGRVIGREWLATRPQVLAWIERGSEPRPLGAARRAGTSGRTSAAPVRHRRRQGRS